MEPLEINQYQAIYYHFPAPLMICQTIYFRVWTAQPNHFLKNFLYIQSKS